MNKFEIKGNSLLKSGVRYSAASTVSSVVVMIVNFANMHWLGPEILGLWQSLTIINAYLPFAQLGIQSGLNLELPILLGRKKQNDVLNIVSTALLYAIILSTVFFITGLIAVSVLVALGKNREVVFGVATITIMAMSTCFRLHYIATYRSAKSFDKLSRIYIIDAVCGLCLVVLIYLFNYYGLLLYSVLKEVIMVSLMFYYAPYRNVHPRFIKTAFKELLKRGLFMTAYNQIKEIIHSFPKILLLKFGGIVQVGLFTPALAVAGLINMIPSQIIQFVQPQLGYKYGETSNAYSMWKYLRKMSIIVPICIIPLSLLGWFVMPYALELLFPKYVDSLWPIRILLFGFIFSINLTRGFLITIKAYKEVLLLQLVDVVCLIAIPLLLIVLRLNTIAVDLAIGMSIGYFVSYFINYYGVKKTICSKKYNEGYSAVERP